MAVHFAPLSLAAHCAQLVQLHMMKRHAACLVILECCTFQHCSNLKLLINTMQAHLTSQLLAVKAAIPLLLLYIALPMQQSYMQRHRWLSSGKFCDGTPSQHITCTVIL